MLDEAHNLVKHHVPSVFRELDILLARCEVLGATAEIQSRKCKTLLPGYAGIPRSESTEVSICIWMANEVVEDQYAAESPETEAVH